MGARFLKSLMPSKSRPPETPSPADPPPLVAKLTRKQLEEYTPAPQPYYAFSGSKWRRGGPPATQQHAPGVHGRPAISSLCLVTWNIDFMAPFPQARMAAALAHLHELVSGSPASTAVVICLQELRQDMPVNLDRLAKSYDPQIADDLRQIASAAWVQEGFLVTDLATGHWRCGYNSVTLVDRRLRVAQVSRLPFVSEYKREALLVDLAVAPSGGGQDAGGAPSILRLCNVHLDSAAGKPPVRPIQWKACARYLQDGPAGVVAGILAGDCNANQGYDLTLPGDNGFRDAYLEMGGKEGDPAGHTWGHQGTSSRYPPARLDKVCFWQPEAGEKSLLRLRGLETIGVGVKVADQSVSAKLTAEGWPDCATDHYGLMADFEVGEAWTLGAA